MNDALGRLLVRATAHLSPGVTEFTFAPPRKWRFDVAWPEARLAVEIDGGVFCGGRHSRGAGYRADAQKLNTATLLGWRVLRVLPEQVRSLECLTYILPALGQGTFTVPTPPAKRKKLTPRLNNLGRG